jgi:hypothetical protein
MIVPATPWTSEAETWRWCLQVLTWDLRGGRSAAVSFGADGPSGEALLQRLPLKPLLASLPGLAQQVPDPFHLDSICQRMP